MRVSNWSVIGLLAIAAASGSAQVRDFQDTYTASEAGKPMAPAKALDVMLSQLETQVLGVAQAMPAEKYGFAPTAETFAPGSPAKYGTVRTFAGQLTHIASANYSFYSKLNGATTPAAAKQVRDLKTKDEILAALKQSFAYGHAQIMTITPQNAFIGIEGADGFHTPATVAAFAVAHGYDHYGQMVEYLRMNGVVPPGSN
jgi:uncharacterized damage-inducible protein DinB